MTSTSLPPRSSTKRSRPVLVLRSSLFSILLWLGVVVYGPFVMLLAPLPYKPRHRIITWFAYYHNWLIRVICGLTCVVEGREHLPSGPAIILPKHQSAWETFAFQTIFPPYVYVLKRELMWLPIFGWAMALLKPIAIDRGAGRAAVEQVIQQGRERLDAGMSVMMFPEGTRMPAGTRGRYKMGGAILAAETGYPVVPVAHNAGSFWARRAVIKYPGVIRVVIGPTIDSRGKKPEAIIKEVEAWIESQMPRLEGRV